MRKIIHIVLLAITLPLIAGCHKETETTPHVDHPSQQIVQRTVSATWTKIPTSFSWITFGEEEASTGVQSLNDILWSLETYLISGDISEVLPEEPLPMQLAYSGYNFIAPPWCAIEGVQWWWIMLRGLRCNFRGMTEREDPFGVDTQRLFISYDTEKESFIEMRDRWRWFEPHSELLHIFSVSTGDIRESIIAQADTHLTLWSAYQWTWCELLPSRSPSDVVQFRDKYSDIISYDTYALFPSDEYTEQAWWGWLEQMLAVCGPYQWWRVNGILLFPDYPRHAVFWEWGENPNKKSINFSSIRIRNW